MFARTAILALLVTLGVGERIAHTDLASCPYPLPAGTTRASLPRDCYIVTAETDAEVSVALANAADVQCRANFVLDSDGECHKVVLRSKTRINPKKSRPQGVPNW